MKNDDDGYVSKTSGLPRSWYEDAIDPPPAALNWRLPILIALGVVAILILLPMLV